MRIAGNEPFKSPHKNVCNLATLYPQYFQVVVAADSGINSIKDLKGKSITTQPRGNTGEVITQHILKVNGLSYTDMKVSFVSYTDSVSQMQDGHAQAFFLGTTVPAGAVMDLASARDVKLLDLSPNPRCDEEDQPGLHAGRRQGRHLSEAGQGREGDRLCHASRRVVQDARGPRATRCSRR